MKFQFGDMVSVNGDDGVIVRTWNEIPAHQSHTMQSYEVYFRDLHSIRVCAEEEITLT